MNGTNVIGGGSVGNPGPSRHVMGTGDYNGAGRTDILFQNTSGAVAIWEISGTTMTGGGTLANPGPLASLIGIARYHEIPVSTKLAEAIASGFQDAARML
jgi:hypothetical protein